jgi:hypothetical protein
MAMTILNPYLIPTPAFAGWTKKIREIRMNKMNYPAAEQRGIYKGIVTPQAAGN